MKIHTRNIIAALFGIAILALITRHGESCRTALETINHVGGQAPVDDRFVGFMVLGLIGVCVVAIVRIVTREGSTNNRRREGDRHGNQED